jgi:cytochrome c-type biogenesis protein CcmH/NrfF
VIEMTPLAHVGHWYHAILYLAPVLLVVVALWLSSLRERRAERDAERHPKS